MKPTLRYLLPALGLAAALPALLAADDDQPASKTEKRQIRILAANDDGSPHGGPRIERHMIVGHAGDGEKESVTFLGVETAPVSATLTAQLGLPEGAGLVVVHLVPDSPAAVTLK